MVGGRKRQKTVVNATFLFVKLVPLISVSVVLLWHSHVRRRMHESLLLLLLLLLVHVLLLLLLSLMLLHHGLCLLHVHARIAHHLKMKEKSNQVPHQISQINQSTHAKYSKLLQQISQINQSTHAKYNQVPHQIFQINQSINQRMQNTIKCHIKFSKSINQSTHAKYNQLPHQIFQINQSMLATPSTNDK